MTPSSLRVAIGVVASTVVAATLTFAPSSSAGDTAPGEVPVRVATYNFRADRSFSSFKKAIDELKSRVAVAGLQEIADTDKSDYLKGDETWGYYRPPELRQNPVVWDTEVFDLVQLPGDHKIADGREIEDKEGGTEYKPDSYATVLRLEHLRTGNLVTIINVHLLSGASLVGKPWPGRPRRFALLTEQIQGTVRLIKREQELDTEVFVTGDFNVGFQADVKQRHRKLPYRRFKRQGFRSMWAGGEELEQRGTYENAYLDQVWAAVAPARRQVARDIKGSDHYPAIATYLLDVEPRHDGE